MKKIACLSGYVGEERKDSGKLSTLVWFSLQLCFRKCSHHQMKVAASFQPVPGDWKTSLVWDQCQAEVLWFFSMWWSFSMSVWTWDISIKDTRFENSILTTDFPSTSTFSFVPQPIIFPCIKNRVSNTSDCFGKLESLFHILNDQACLLLYGIQIMWGH